MTTKNNLTKRYFPVEFITTKIPKELQLKSCSGCIDEINGNCKRKCKNFERYRNETNLFVLISKEPIILQSYWNPEIVNDSYYYNSFENEVRKGKVRQPYHYNIIATYPKLKNLPTFNIDLVKDILTHFENKKKLLKIDIVFLYDIETNKKYIKLYNNSEVKGFVDYENNINKEFEYKIFNNLIEIYNTIKFCDDKKYILNRLENTIDNGINLSKL